MKYENICNHFKTVIKENPVFYNIAPIRDTSLLLPEFATILDICFKKYEEKYPKQKVFITETYRSNELQFKYYKNGKSKIKKDGMHHFGIAVDVAFLINRKVSYKGDYNFLRKMFKENQLTVLDWEMGHVQYIPVSEQNALRIEIQKPL